MNHPLISIKESQILLILKTILFFNKETVFQNTLCIYIQKITLNVLLRGLQEPLRYEPKKPHTLID